MPTYEFRCQNCGQVFEEHQRVEEHGRQVPACPQCKSSDKVEPQLSRFHAVTSRKA
ncbi:MAG: zinc ribbon domain-containing protein [Deltaproteobacteria bacterium]|nr:zinc ribbon domain-containing protein [Deltaproteobacteria bacterium]